MPILLLFLSLMYSVTSCSGSEEKDEVSFDKTSSVEYKNFNYFEENDGSISKFVNGKKGYTLIVDTDITFNELNSNVSLNEKSYKVSNPSTGEFIDLINVEKKDGYFVFNAKTSTGVQLNNLKYFGADFLSNSNINASNNGNVVECPACIVRIVAVVVAVVVDGMSSSPLEQCRAAIPAASSCPPGQGPFMKFSEGWFSTSCETGCR